MKAHLLKFFSEEKSPYSLFAITLLSHVAVFYALLYLYGPCSFFLSNDCRVNGNDTQHYVILAENLSHGHGYSRFVDPPYEPDALRTPILSLYFAPFTYLADYQLIWLAILLLNIVLSLAPVLLYKLSRFFLPHAYALVAAFFLVFEPLYLYRSQIAEPDALLVLLLLASIYFVVRSWHRDTAPDIYRAALLLGLAILSKPSALYLTILIFIFEAAFLLLQKRDTQRQLKHLGLALVITCVVVTPWMVRNVIVFGVPAVSSIQGYNLYQYYTAQYALPDEHIPPDMELGSREPSRYLPYQGYFTGVALARIEAHKGAYLTAHLVGSLRNLFVSDISQIFYYGHGALLPFPYNPESKASLHQLLLDGNIGGAIRSLFNVQVLPKIIWILCLLIVYLLALLGWIFAWRRDRATFLAFTMFFCLFGYLIVASGPFVDAKYRLPAILLIVLVALYGLERVVDYRALRRVEN